MDLLSYILPGRRRRLAAEHAVRLALQRAVAPFARTTWVPDTTPGDGEPTASKFGGVAYITTDGQWPTCGHCERPMELLVQLNRDDVPSDAAWDPGGQLIQLFYCTNYDAECECEAEGYLPFSEVSCVRLLDVSGEPGVHSHPLDAPFEAKQITGWTKRTDYPNNEELREIADVPRECLRLNESEPAEGEKLLGWPYWVQGVEYPNCPTCGRRMAFVFQIDSEKNLPIMFGDTGVGHLTQCPVHKDVLAFSWACL